MRLAELQERMARVLASPDPRAALDELKAAADPATRAHLERVQGQGLELAATLILKLRFDRVMRADPAFAREYDGEPDAFTRQFLDYCAANPCQAYFPAEEAARFQAWRSRANSPDSAGSSSG